MFPSSSFASYKPYFNMIKRYADLALTLLGLIVSTLFNSSKMQATPGKYLLDMKIITKDVERISFLRALVRILSPYIIIIILTMVFTIFVHSWAPSLDVQVLATISYYVVVLFTTIISALLLIFTKEKTALHDLIAGTRVVRR